MLFLSFSLSTISSLKCSYLAYLPLALLSYASLAEQLDQHFKNANMSSSNYNPSMASIQPCNALTSTLQCPWWNSSSNTRQIWHSVIWLLSISLASALVTFLPESYAPAWTHSNMPCAPLGLLHMLFLAYSNLTLLLLLANSYLFSDSILSLLPERLPLSLVSVSS